MENFIGIYDGAMSDDDCDNIIDFFETNTDRHTPGVISRTDGKSNCCSKDVKDSTDLVLNFDENIDINYKIALAISRGLIPYKIKLPILNHISEWTLTPTYNLQRYYPGQGFHRPHCENSTGESLTLLAWMIYLNDVTDGGETRFEFQDLNIRPKKGTLVIWPAYFTHVHYGLSSATQTKYIATGWHKYYA